MITKEFIGEEYLRVLSEVSELLPSSTWRHTPKGWDLTSEKTKYGLASKSGIIYISKAFLGTQAYTKLDYTLRHELAHFAVGLNKHHNKVFRRVERMFGVDLSRDLTGEIEQILANISFKYSLIAHLENGEKRDLGGVHRKDKKYTSYPDGSRYTLSIDAIRIVNFEYLER